jgi:hypothetical protein
MARGSLIGARTHAAGGATLPSCLMPAPVLPFLLPWPLALLIRRLAHESVGD